MRIKKRRRIAKSETSYVLTLRVVRICEYCLAPVGRFKSREEEKMFNATRCCKKCTDESIEEFLEHGEFIFDDVVSIPTFQDSTGDG